MWLELKARCFCDYTSQVDGLKKENKMYRPKGWENQMPCGECTRTTAGNNCATSCHLYIRYQSKESGADAMLEGLKVSGVVMKNYTPTNRTVAETAWFLNQAKDGTLVFVPEE